MTAPAVGEHVTPTEQVEHANRALYEVLHVATYFGARYHAVVVYRAVRPDTGRVYVRAVEDFASRYTVVTLTAPPESPE